MSAHNEPDRRAGLVVLGLASVAGLFLRLVLAFSDHGIYWPDEIFQTLEPAHRLVYGYGLVPWEFVDGARSWTLPGLLAGILQAGRWVGLDEPRQYLALVRVVLCLVSIATVWSCFLLARTLGASTLPAACGAAAFALAPPMVYFSYRALSEPVASLPVVLGFALALSTESRWKRLVGVSLLGLATLIRLQSALFCLGILGIYLGRRRGRLALEALCVLAAWAFLYGLIDRLTWGSWFQSAARQVGFNLVEGRCVQWGTSPPSYYPRVLWTSFGPCLALVFAVLIAAARQARGLTLTALGFVLCHMAIPHKEYRFILPVLGLLFALGALGLQTLALRLSPMALAAGAVLVVTVASATTLLDLRFGQIGAYEWSRPEVSAYDDNGAVNRLLLAAHDQPDLCGLKVEAAHLAWTGGSTYLHRPVPLYTASGPGRQSGYYNYVITRADRSGSGEIVARDGGLALVRISRGACIPDRSYLWRTP